LNRLHDANSQHASRAGLAARKASLASAQEALAASKVRLAALNAALQPQMLGARTWLLPHLGRFQQEFPVVSQFE
jgi:hypothetical protein